MVGGGISGLTTALLLARAGCSVRLLEAGALGRGTTGGSTAKVTALQGARLGEIRQLHGDEALRTYLAAQVEATEWIVDRAHERAVHGVERRDAVTCTADPGRVEEVVAQAAAADAAGLPVTYAEGDPELPHPIAAAVRLADQIQIDPRSWVADLAAELVDLAGSVVHEDSAVTGFADGGRTVVTAHGRVRADHVVLATLTPIRDRGLTFARAEPSMSHSLAVTVEGAAPRSMYYELGESARSLRQVTLGTGEEVLVVGGAGHTVGRESDPLARQRELLDWTEERFTVTDVLHRWAVHDMTPVDRLPFVGRADRLPGAPWIISGLGKWGMTNGVAAALTVAGAITGAPERDWDRLVDPARLGGARPAARALQLNVEVGVEMARGWVAPRSSPGARDVSGDGGEGDGPGAEVLPPRSRRTRICPHLGGIVSPNAAECTWDCPLHGSRFAADGTPLTGPTRRGLPE